MTAGPTYTPIATTTLGSDTQTISFTSIPSTYTDLVLVFTGICTTSGTNLAFRFNNDSGSNYSFTRLRGYSGTFTGDYYSPYSMGISGPLSYGTINSIITLNIMNYANTSMYKTVYSRSNSIDYASTSGILGNEVNLWRNTTVINRVDISPEFGQNFLSGAIATLYGVKEA